MKRILFICCALFLGTTFLTAQSDTERVGKRGDRSERAQLRNERAQDRGTRALERLTKSLDLTEEQVTRIQSFQTANETARKAEMQAATSREERVEIGKKYLSLADEQITSVLTAEQREKYTNLKAKRAENAERRKAERGNREDGDRRRRPRPESAPEETGGGF